MQCCEEAKERGDIDVVICDTAGRLHTAYALMEELEVSVPYNCVCMHIYMYP